MQSPEGEQKTFCIFISYHEKIMESVYFVKQLKEFFNKWGFLRCDLVSDYEGLDPVEKIILNAVEQSNYFIQCFSTKPETSAWMEKELNFWKANLHKKGENLLRNFIVLYTGQTNMDNALFKKYKILADEGLFWFIQIDKKEEAQKFLYKILVQTGCMPKSHGEIVMPRFCREEQISINLDDIEEFIKNFRNAKILGLERVFDTRFTAEGKLIERLEKLQENQAVRMIGFTLHRFVHPKNKSGIGKVFLDAITRNAKAELLLLDPKCFAAKNRIRVENQTFYQQNMYEKSLFRRNSKEVHEFYNNKDFGGKVSIQHYRTPYVGIVLFDNEVFVEIYHLGKQISEEEGDQEICGRVPILNIRKDSSYFEVFQSHFDNMWKEE